MLETDHKYGNRNKKDSNHIIDFEFCGDLISVPVVR